MKIITMTLTKDRDLIAFDGKLVLCSCVVLNEFNGRVAVVYTENEDGSRGVPYMPRMFPASTGSGWTVGTPRAIDPVNDPHMYLWPFFIPTDAHQLVDEWEIDQDETPRYVAKTGRQVMDWGYGVHFSASPRTLGCEKITSEADLRWMVGRINEIRANGDVVKLLAA